MMAYDIKSKTAAVLLMCLYLKLEFHFNKASFNTLCGLLTSVISHSRLQLCLICYITHPRFHLQTTITCNTTTSCSRCGTAFF